MQRDPPYRITTERLTVRCWDPRDAPLLKEAIDESLDHLRPWMAWADDEPQTLEEKVRLLRRFRGAFDLGENFVYGIFSRDESEVVGGIGLHPRAGEDAFEIGYWIRASRARQGLAGEAVAALSRAGFEVAGAERIEINVDPENTASLGVPRKLGFREEATLRRRSPRRPGEPLRDTVVFSLFGDEVDGTAVAEARFEAFDAAGARLS
ncbi:MAG: GNAT family N-acetyltransferase [Actinomycetota bacterium]|nr:GNAT family N-acetyltransferase [Actinomycetota bacterium]